MLRKAGLIGFLALQATAIAVWVSALLPYLGGSEPIFESAQQIWSGGGYSTLDSNFRTGSNVVGAARFHPFGPLGQGSVLMALAGLAAAAAIYLFGKSRIWAASGAGLAALALGAGGNWLIATQWQGDTAFPEGYLNTYLLNALTRAFNTQFYFGFAALALCSVLLIAGVSTRERPLGFGFAALNWIVVAVVWLVFYVVFHLAPFPFGNELWSGS